MRAPDKVCAATPHAPIGLRRRGPSSASALLHDEPAASRSHFLEAGPAARVTGLPVSQHPPGTSLHFLWISVRMTDAVCAAPGASRNRRDGNRSAIIGTASDFGTIDLFIDGDTWRNVSGLTTPAGWTWQEARWICG